MNIDVQLITSNNFRKGRRSGIKYIVMHDTGTPGATAQNEHDYFNNNNNLKVSAHYFVDKNGAIQIVADGDTAWHCGDGAGKYGITNDNSIGVEICTTRISTIDGQDDRLNTSSPTAWKNSAQLASQLMARHGIPIDRVVRHYDASRKNCPATMSANGWARWNDFVADVAELSSSGSSSETAPDSENQTPNTSLHWVKKYLDDLVERKIIQTPLAWEDFDAPATKGQVVAIISKMQRRDKV